MGMVFSVNFGDWNGNDLVGMPGWEIWKYSKPFLAHLYSMPITRVKTAETEKITG